MSTIQLSPRLVTLIESVKELCEKSPKVAGFRIAYLKLNEILKIKLDDTVLLTASHYLLPGATLSIANGQIFIHNLKSGKPNKDFVEVWSLSPMETLLNSFTKDLQKRINTWVALSKQRQHKRMIEDLLIDTGNVLLYFTTAYEEELQKQVYVSMLGSLYNSIPLKVVLEAMFQHTSGFQYVEVSKYEYLVSYDLGNCGHDCDYFRIRLEEGFKDWATEKFASPFSTIETYAIRTQEDR